MQLGFLLILLIFIGFIVWNWLQRRKRQQRLKDQTLASRSQLTATVKRIEEKKSIHLVKDETGSHEVEHVSYIIVAQAEHPRTHDLLTFRSFPFSEYPSAHSEGSSLPVSVDLESPTHYELKVK